MSNTTVSNLYDANAVIDPGVAPTVIGGGDRKTLSGTVVTPFAKASVDDADFVGSTCRSRDLELIPFAGSTLQMQGHP